jgi:hypothetical protein
VSESTLCKLSVCSSASSYNELLLILNVIEKEILTHVIGIQELLKAVVPFDVLLDRKQRNWGLGAPARQGDGSMKKKTKVVRDAEVALAALAACEEALDRELLIATS